VTTRLNVFESISLDGFFSGANGDFSWAHAVKQDPDFDRFVSGNAQGGGALLLGRTTYEIMASHWPTEKAKQQMPKVAEGMNRMTKYVVSRSMKSAAWENTTILSGDLVTEIRKLKAKDGPGLTILGSGSLVAQLTEAGLIDGYTFVVVAVSLGKGRPLFEGVTRQVRMDLKDSKSFKNGNVVLSYEPTR